ncbi:MAG: UTP--glucose-1-phosphate uridylyltransferase [Candidatus Gracilibacteria bacterium]|nr:UTP--glucose-1-phosphate uridylyltransferase [Candidatus Gracilibacteria bacterium]MDD5178747.1 UTP--glucose-1-phosphate uridylyltransferase [Candidatus Gracilibacteria bacterium]
MKKIRKAVLPVAGFGTRNLPATKSIPKELLPIVDTPALQLLVEEAVAAGIEEIIFVVSPGKTAIQEYFSPSLPLEEKLKEAGKNDLLQQIQWISQLAKFTYVNQAQQLGDGHAILQAQQAVDGEAFLVLFGDEIVVSTPSLTTELLAAYTAKESSIVALQQVSPAEVSRYGIIQPGIREENLVEIAGFVEKPKPADAPSDLAIIGKYICTPAIFPILAAHPNSSGEIRLIDALSELLASEKVYGLVANGERYDLGDKFGFVKANLDFALQHPETASRMQAYLRELAGRLKS